MYRSTYRLAPNLFGISFGTAGLAQLWTLARHTTEVPDWPGAALWITAAALWAVTATAYCANALSQGRLRSEPAHPTTGPFTALLPIIPMLLGVALEPYAGTAGKVVFVIGLAGTLALGAWLTGAWIRLEMRLTDWHPGYFLPTVAGGLIAAGCAATFGWVRLSQLMFGYGTVCWFVLGSILLVRLFTQPALPAPLLPTIAIEFAPPLVASNAWFVMNGGRADLVATALAGYALLMALVQLSLTGTYRKAPFGPPYWSFAFSYAVGFTVTARWLQAEDVPARTEITYALLGLATVAYGALFARTVLGLVRGTFLPRAPA
ncbi:TDT family transporter [Streptomyces sp. BPPL-273]|uniref:SLAC1 family transporter n=1 Tax=Streptomyces sp. BPPL-273 TaxID=2987533 RepID=UPI0024AE9AE1|nr:TDT family transporter [Streptomyces sp. BPPL-273]WHM28729.1 TDT family transporter [Streptomyces sp. BPPL-273]